MKIIAYILLLIALVGAVCGASTLADKIIVFIAYCIGVMIGLFVYSDVEK